VKLAPIGLTNSPGTPALEYFQVRVDLLIGTNCTIEFNDTMLSLANGLSLSILERPVSPGDRTNSINCVRLRLSRFPSHELAVESGQRLVQSLLWCAISYRASFQLVGPESPPFIIEPYGASDGIQVSAFGHVFYTLSPDSFQTALDEVFSSNTCVPPRLQTAMDIVARVWFERSKVAQFIQIVTSLEALAEQMRHDANIAKALEIAAKTLSSNEIFDHKCYVGLKKPLVDGIRRLRRQGVMDAIESLLFSNGFTTEEIEFVKRQYTKRSDILHEGIPCELNEEDMRKLENIVRRLIAAQIGLTLVRECE
jgi:hypothetical protein